ncbi:hypothetical protein SLEP1_g32011 [Rubroshorea leprosula]|uniref:Uncharacterized protein n=1 Tax=Rubroshorea leprosula TaxID=152421 RepID=A0AAV5KBZ4_9ROSI|nr:hypothetical protein SLEP1_g32011 [Rubroshorea leprosula]
MAVHLIETEERSGCRRRGDLVQSMAGAGRGQRARVRAWARAQAWGAARAGVWCNRRLVWVQQEARLGGPCVFQI